MIESLREKLNWAVEQPSARRQDGGRGGLTQSFLASLPEFNMTSTGFNKFLKRGQLNADQLDVLCKWLGCSTHAFSRFSLEAFKQSPNGEALSWSMLLGAAVRMVQVELDGPRDDLQLLGAGPVGKQIRTIDQTPPEFAPGSAIRIVSPVDVAGVSTAGWNLIVFGSDEDGTDNLLPRFAADFGYIPDCRIPVDQDEYVFPEAPETLSIYADARNGHSLALVAHRDPLPEALVHGLATASEPRQLAPQLELLASWLGGRDPQTYRVLVHEYSVSR